MALNKYGEKKGKRAETCNKEQIIEPLFLSVSLREKGTQCRTSKHLHLGQMKQSQPFSQFSVGRQRMLIEDGEQFLGQLFLLHTMGAIDMNRNGSQGLNIY